MQLQTAATLQFPLAKPVSLLLFILGSSPLIIIIYVMELIYSIQLNSEPPCQTEFVNLIL